MRRKKTKHCKLVFAKIVFNFKFFINNATIFNFNRLEELVKNKSKYDELIMSRNLGLLEIK